MERTVKEKKFSSGNDRYQGEKIMIRSIDLHS